MLKPATSFALLLFMAACNAPPPPPPPPPPAPKTVATLPPRTQPVTLDKLGLKFEGPRGCSVRDESEKQELKEHVQCAQMLFDVTVPSRSDPKTFDQAKKAARVHAHLVIQKEEQTADGWNIQFHSSDLGTDMYQVWIRRKIGGKTFECDAMTAQPEEAANSANACTALASL